MGGSDVAPTDVSVDKEITADPENNIGKVVPVDSGTVFTDVGV